MTTEWSGNLASLYFEYVWNPGAFGISQEERKVVNGALTVRVVNSGNAAYNIEVTNKSGAACRRGAKLGTHAHGITP
ncbi:MAG: hypothetical protein HY680_07880 [Chloroflexi bacterium]|nr:hypothetical protein [Chloroflexota bacterium]